MTALSGFAYAYPVTSQTYSRKIDVDGVVELYEHYIIPLTKEVEVSLLAFLACA